MTTAHIDTFARDNLPATGLQPDFLFNLPELQFGEHINCATELLDRHIQEGRGNRVCIRGKDMCWTYRDLNDRANQIANVLTREMGLVPGNRVLLHAVWHRQGGWHRGGHHAAAALKRTQTDSGHRQGQSRVM